MMIRLLQSFSEINWSPEACPGAVPPAEWTEAGEGDGRKSQEKAWLKAHLTMYAHVSTDVSENVRVVLTVLQNGFWVNMREA